MRNAIVVVTLLAFTTAFSASAQNAPPSASSATPAAVSTLHPDVKSHLTAGAQIFSGDTVVGTVATVDEAAGKVIINEASIGASVADTRVLPASSIAWSNNRLITTVTAEQIKKLPNQ